MTSYVFGALSAATAAAADYFCPAKPDQKLDPIATVCMFTLRTIESFRNAKPAVRDNWFEFDGEGTPDEEATTTVEQVSQSVNKAAQGTMRAASKVSNNDLFYVNAAIDQFVHGWKGRENPALVKIVQVAIKGLELMNRRYKARQINAAPATELYQLKLQAWVNSAFELPKPSPVVSLEQEQRRNGITASIIQKLRKKYEAEQNPLVHRAIAQFEQSVKEWLYSTSIDLPQPALQAGQNDDPECKVAIRAAATELLLEMQKEFKGKEVQKADEQKKEISLNAIGELERHMKELSIAKNAPAEAPAALSAEDVAVIRRTNELWPQQQIDAFEGLLRRKEENVETIKKFLNERKDAYIRRLQYEEEQLKARKKEAKNL